MEHAWSGHFRFLRPDELGAPAHLDRPALAAVVPVRGWVSAGELREGRGGASRLLEAFRSCALFPRTEGHRWVRRWPGTTKGGKALRFLVPSPGLAVRTWGELLAHPFGRWEDPQLVDARGLLAFAISHEGLVAIRVEGPGRAEPGVFEDRGEGGEPLDPEQVALLTGR